MPVVLVALTLAFPLEHPLVRSAAWLPIVAGGRFESQPPARPRCFAASNLVTSAASLGPVCFRSCLFATFLAVAEEVALSGPRTGVGGLCPVLRAIVETW
jgi:hypothetical protein